MLGASDVGVVEFYSRRGFKLELIFIVVWFFQLRFNGLGGNDRPWYLKRRTLENPRRRHPALKWTHRILALVRDSWRYCSMGTPFHQ